MLGSASSAVYDDTSKHEALYYCDKHGVMNKTTDLVENVNQITKRK
jgi:hypothetical protein